MVCGNMGLYKGTPRIARAVKVIRAIQVPHFRKSTFVPLEFIGSEAKGTELPRRCPGCENRKECQFQMDNLAVKENAEYRIILGKFRLDKERKKWIAS
jgi:hypothetical protein